MTKAEIDPKMFEHALKTWGDKMTKAEIDDIFGEFEIDEDYMIKTNDVLGLDHVVLIDLELTEDVVDLSLGHLVSPGLKGVLKHLGVNLALVVVGLERLDNEVVRVVALTGHLLLEHLDHVVIGARSRDLAQQTVELRLAH